MNQYSLWRSTNCLWNTCEQPNFQNCSCTCICASSREGIHSLYQINKMLIAFPVYLNILSLFSLCRVNRGPERGSELPKITKVVTDNNPT